MNCRSNWQSSQSTLMRQSSSCSSSSNANAAADYARSIRFNLEQLIRLEDEQNASDEQHLMGSPSATTTAQLTNESVACNYFINLNDDCHHSRGRHIINDSEDEDDLDHHSNLFEYSTYNNYNSNQQQTMGRLFDSLQDYVRSKRQIGYRQDPLDSSNTTLQTECKQPIKQPAAIKTNRICSNMFKCAFNYDERDCNSTNSYYPAASNNTTTTNKNGSTTMKQQHNNKLASSLKRYVKQTFCIHHNGSSRPFHLSPSILLAMLFSFLLTTASLVCLITLHNMSNNHQFSVHQLSPANTTQPKMVTKQVTNNNNNGQQRESRKLRQSQTLNHNTIEPAIAVKESSKQQQQQQATDSGGTDSDRRFDEARSVQTECGKFVGLIERDAIVFRGIPYALAPLKQRRWQRPTPIWEAPTGPSSSPTAASMVSIGVNFSTTRIQPDAAATAAAAQIGKQDSTVTGSSLEAGQQWCEPGNVFKAYQHAAICQQLSPLSHTFIGHENCLYLDIWAPRLDSKRRPVMVYIHGGFLSFGSSGQGGANLFDVSPSSEVALAMDCVIVSFNYRLQALGFLTLEQLANSNGPNGSLGNYGLWDQLCALRWIKRNIVNFGGDSNNIILFGPDSASALPLAFLANELQAFPTADIASLATDNDTNAELNDDDDDDDDTSNAADQEQLIEEDRHLYHAVWLTNPSLYFDVPFSVSAKHNAHTFLHNLPINCLLVNNVQNETEPASLNNNLLRCLYSMSSEQIIRHFLGQDEPSYRLDDQNDLPIHGILADQLVVVDNELISNPFPFRPTTGQHPSANSRQSFKQHYDRHQRPRRPPQRSAPKMSYDEPLRSQTVNNKQQTDEVASFRRKRILIGSSQQAVEYWPCPRDIAQWSWQDFTRYVITSLNSFSSSAVLAASKHYPHILIEHHDATNGTNTANMSETTTPMELYLTMVSDIRQICPVNELVRELSHSGHRTTNVHRYIIDHRPDRPVWLTAQNAAQQDGRMASNQPVTPGVQRQQQPHQQQEDHKPRLAFHMWDLIAFFNSSSGHFVSESELKFQRQIRELIRSFIHAVQRPPPAGHDGQSSIQSWLSSDDNNGQSKEQGPMKNIDNKIAVIGRDASLKLVDTYKYNECKMWRKYLGRDYAWVS